MDRLHLTFNSHFLYPRPDLDERTREGTETANGQTTPGDGRHELFSVVNESIRKQIKELVLSGLFCKLEVRKLNLFV